MIEALFTTEAMITLVTLTLLEIVLGIDNLIFITLTANGLPPHQRQKARLIGLGLALIIRVAMLFSIAWIMGLTQPLLTIMENELSFRDLLLIAGGVFLIYKTTQEMHYDLAGKQAVQQVYVQRAFGAAVFQIIMVDLVFSFDSIITAVGLTENIPVIVIAVVISMVVMIMLSETISHFLERYPTFKMLALSFILMIGTFLIAQGLDFDVPKGYIYFAFGFSIFVEALNTVAMERRAKRNQKQD
jgi:predicted tellurium resistance membrane protein TerC